MPRLALLPYSWVDETAANGGHHVAAATFGLSIKQCGRDPEAWECV